MVMNRMMLSNIAMKCSYLWWPSMKGAWWGGWKTICAVLTMLSPSWVLARRGSSPSSRMKAHFMQVNTSQTSGELTLTFEVLILILLLLEKAACWWTVSWCPALSTYQRLTHKPWVSYGHALGLSDWWLVIRMTVWEPQSNLGAGLTVSRLCSSITRTQWSVSLGLWS